MHSLAMPVILLSGDTGASTTTSGGLSQLFDVGTQFVDFAFDILDLIIAHPYLSIFFAVGILGLAVGLIGKFAGASKSIG